MAGISSVGRRGHTWGLWAAAASRVVGRMARRNRLLRATTAAVQTSLRSFLRVFHLLWLEITGLFFLLFAVVGGSAAWHEYHKTGMASRKMVAAVCFSILFGWFGLTSFWRVRRKSHARED